MGAKVGAIKGFTFERWCCKQLSLWWTDGKRDDIFWRTAGSGARAKIRSKKNKNTYGQYGDVTAIDPIGSPLIKMFTIELKRGYSKHTVADLLDKPPGAKKQKYEQWFEEIEKDASLSGSIFWILIVQRNRRLPIIFFPMLFVEKISIISRSLNLTYEGLFKWKRIGAMLLEEWFSSIKPDYITCYMKTNSYISASSLVVDNEPKVLTLKSQND